MNLVVVGCFVDIRLRLAVPYKQRTSCHQFSVQTERHIIESSMSIEYCNRKTALNLVRYFLRD